MYKHLLTIWHQFYQEKTGQTYIYDGQQCKHLKLLIKKIETKVTERGMEVNEENMVNSFKGFLMSITDTWILANLDISIVNSKFNILYSNAVRNNPFTERERLAKIIDRLNPASSAG